MTERVCIQCKEKKQKKANNGKALHLQQVKQINICMYIFLFSIDTFVKRSRLVDDHIPAITGNLQKIKGEGQA